MIFKDIQNVRFRDMPSREIVFDQHRFYFTRLMGGCYLVTLYQQIGPSTYSFANAHYQSRLMAIKKQEFYEGAALHALACSSDVSIRYTPPFFICNNKLLVHLKYSTKNRSPWGFTFWPEEQTLLRKTASRSRIIVGLVCGFDGVAAIDYEDYRSVAAPRKTALRISCSRLHREHYEVKGPDGKLDRKVPPSNWKNILEI